MTTPVYETVEMISQEYWWDETPGRDMERTPAERRIPELRFLRQTPNSSLLTFPGESS